MLLRPDASITLLNQITLPWSMVASLNLNAIVLGSPQTGSVVLVVEVTAVVVVRMVVDDDVLVVLLVVGTIVDVLVVVGRIVLEDVLLEDVLLEVEELVLGAVEVVVVVGAPGGVTVRLNAPLAPPHEPANPSTMM